MSRISRDSILLFLCCMAIGLFTVMNSLENPLGRDQVSDIGPNGYVQLLCGILVLLGFISVIQEMMKTKRPVIREEDQVTASPATIRKIALMMISLLIFMLVLPYLGFIASSILLMVVNTMIIRGRRVNLKEGGLQILFAVITVLLIYFSFSVLVGIELP